MNNKGYTLFEVVISIAVASLVLTMLTQMLATSVKMEATIERESLLFNQSTSITDTIQNEIFEFQAHNVELVSDTDASTIIRITHEYDIVINDSGVLAPDFSNPQEVLLVYDKINETITFDGEMIHSANAKILEGSSITLIALNEEVCTDDPESDLCQEAMIKLDLIITIQRDLLDPETRVQEESFTSTIII